MIIDTLIDLGNGLLTVCCRQCGWCLDISAPTRVIAEAVVVREFSKHECVEHCGEKQ